MGFISTGIKSITGALYSQYKDAISCEDMAGGILMVKKTGKKGLIRQGSKVIVAPGQVAVMVDNGRIVDATGEGGVYEFDSDAAPTFFGGDFGSLFSEMWTRFSYGGAAWQDQAIYFINTKEIMDNGFGTPAPVPYRDWERCVSNARTGGLTPLRIDIRCHGTYSFKIEDPAAFMYAVGGTAEVYRKEELVAQIKNEIVSVLQQVLNSLCDEQHKVYPLLLPQKSAEVTAIMEQQGYDRHVMERGVRIVGLQILSVTPDQASKERMDKYDESGDFAFQQAELTGAMRDAANNAAGAGVGFMNVNMANAAAGGMFGQGGAAQTVAQQGANVLQGQAPAQQAQGEATCPACGAKGTGKFCASCGAALPQARFCSHCGAQVTGKFCAACGEKVE